LTAALPREIYTLLFSLDSLGNNLEIQPSRHGDGRRHNRGVGVEAGDPADEGLIDLRFASAAKLT
jgi:hypothetical protein